MQTPNSLNIHRQVFKGSKLFFSLQLNFYHIKMNGFAASVSTGKRLEGKVAIITGGASGIGACTARLFLQHGAKVIVADVQDSLGLSVCKSLSSQDVSYVHCDVTCEPDLKNVVDIAISKYGKLDIMYNNAGIPGECKEPKILGTEYNDFKRVLEVNLLGGFLGAKEAARVMIPARTGVILFTSSISAVVSGVCTHAYSVSKVAILGLMRNLCVELGEYGIRVNSVSPGAVGTPMLTSALGIGKSDVESAYEASTVLKGVVAKEEDVAEAALYLAGDKAKCISGQNIVVDGGYSTTNLAFNKKLMALFTS